MKKGGKMDKNSVVSVCLFWVVVLIVCFFFWKLAFNLFYKPLNKVECSIKQINYLAPLGLTEFDSKLKQIQAHVFPDQYKNPEVLKSYIKYSMKIELSDLEFERVIETSL
jgi:hypothetical protein